MSSHRTLKIYFGVVLGVIRRVISANSSVKLEIGFPSLIPLAIFFKRVIRFGSVVILTVLILVSALLISSATLVLISSVFFASIPDFVSKPTMAVEPVITTVADLTPSTFSAALANFVA